MNFHNTWKKISEFFKKVAAALKANARDGIRWAGADGLLNMETAALLTIALGIFLPVMWSMIVSFIGVLVKCSTDEKRGRAGEVHDLVCATVGVVIGAILLIAL